MFAIGQGVQKTVRITDNVSTLTFHYSDSTKHSYYKPQILRIETFKNNPYLVYVHTTNNRTEKVDVRDLSAPEAETAEELAYFLNVYLLLLNQGFNGGDSITLIQPELPTIQLEFYTIRLDGDDSTEVAVAHRAPTLEDSMVVGSVGREYTILPGFRYFSIIFLPDAVEDCSLTINGLDYSANQGIYGRSLPERGDYKTSINERYKIIAGEGCKVEITETR